MAWEKVEKDSWNSVAYISGVAATEQDVKEGRAVFYIPSGSKPYLMELPKLAYFFDEENSLKEKVIVIQAESVEEQVYIGYRKFEPGNGLCSLSDIEFC